MRWWARQELLHPPGRAAVVGSAKRKTLSYPYVLSLMLPGVLILFGVAMVFSNVTSHHSYPANKQWLEV